MLIHPIWVRFACLILHQLNTVGHGERDRRTNRKREKGKDREIKQSYNLRQQQQQQKAYEQPIPGRQVNKRISVCYYFWTTGRFYERSSLSLVPSHLYHFLYFIEEVNFSSAPFPQTFRNVPLYASDISIYTHPPNVFYLGCWFIVDKSLIVLFDFHLNFSHLFGLALSFSFLVIANGVFSCSIVSLFSCCTNFLLFILIST